MRPHKKDVKLAFEALSHMLMDEDPTRYSLSKVLRDGGSDERTVRAVQRVDNWIHSPN